MKTFRDEEGRTIYFVPEIGSGSPCTGCMFREGGPSCSNVRVLYADCTRLPGGIFVDDLEAYKIKCVEHAMGINVQDDE